MVKAVKGSLVECEPAMKQLLIKLNTESQFIVEDLSETHLLVDSNYVELLGKKFQAALEENVFKLSESVDVKSTW